MILTKIQIIQMLLDGYVLPERIIKKVIRKHLDLPEVEFEERVQKELNFRLEPIRKNQYIIT